MLQSSDTIALNKKENSLNFITQIFDEKLCIVPYVMLYDSETCSLEKKEMVLCFIYGFGKKDKHKNEIILYIVRVF